MAWELGSRWEPTCAEGGVTVSSRVDLRVWYPLEAQVQALATASMKLGEAIYGQGGGEGGPDADAAAADAANDAAQDAEIVDADYEEVDDQKAS